ncbi:MAG: hypothetical protein II729_06065 [Ruminococcus sp.]|nr:hypothetical protein [Ruminococcus sp.]
MRKIIPTFAVCFAMAASFASCGSKDSSSSESKKEKGLLGKWNMSDEMMTEFVGDTEGIKVISGTMEFKDNNKAIIEAKLDYSDVMSLTDEKFLLQDYKLDIVEFTGTELSVGIGSEVSMTFTRDENSDDMYGTYNFMSNEDEEDTELEDMKYTITFEKDGKTYANIVGSKPYIYDEEKHEIKTDEGDDTPAKIEIDGDKLTITDSQGDPATLTRADQ